MIKISLERRPTRIPLLGVISPLLALAITLTIGALMFAILGEPPLEALYVYFIEPVTEVWSIHELLIKATPLILIAVGLAVCFSSNNWNIGAEGQFIMGAIAGSALPVLLPDVTGPLVLPLMLIMGVAGGAAYATIPALLKARFHTNEILSSLMLVYVAQLFLDWIVRGPWRNPEGFNFPETRRFHADAILPEIASASGRAHLGFVFAIIAAIAIWFMMSRTMKGFEIRVLGQSPRAGRFAGFSHRKMVFFAFLLSGGLAGLAGISEVSGAIGQLRPTISPGYGFTAIIVAFLGRLNPLGIIAAGLILALSYLGGEAAQISLGVSNKVAAVFQGLILFSVLSCDTLINYKVKVTRTLSARSAQPGNAS
ncbi:MAG: ABC transporter permease [Pseudomonadota bacterium]